MNFHKKDEVFKIRNILNVKKIFLLLLFNYFCIFWSNAYCEQSTIKVLFGNGEQIEVSNWSFVYHAIRSDRVLAKGDLPNLLKKESRNLYLLPRYDNEADKVDFGKGEEIAIDLEKLSTIEYSWNRQFGYVNKVFISLTDGTELERQRFGPVALSIFGDTKFLTAKGIYLQGDYSLNKKSQKLSYNLNKWQQVGQSKKDIIVKIVFHQLP